MPQPLVYSYVVTNAFRRERPALDLPFKVIIFKEDTSDSFVVFLLHSGIACCFSPCFLRSEAERNRRQEVTCSEFAVFLVHKPECSDIGGREVFADHMEDLSGHIGDICARISGRILDWRWHGFGFAGVVDKVLR
jgi:hypothetical protein